MELIAQLSRKIAQLSRQLDLHADRTRRQRLEAQLARSADIYDLERRLRALTR